MDTNTSQEIGGAPEMAVTKLLSWEAPAMSRHNRSRRWYLVGGVIVIATATYGILTGGWSVAVVAVLVGCMYFLLRGTQPPLKQISLTTHGVFFDSAFTRWEDCTGFWIVATSQDTKLHIERRNRRQGNIVILLENVGLESVRWTLAQFLSEQTDRGETALDAIIRICKL